MQISDFFAPSPSLRNTPTMGLLPQSGHVDGVDLLEVTNADQIGIEYQSELSRHFR